MNALTELDQSLFELLMSFILFHSFIDPPDSSVDYIYLHNCLTIKHYMHLTEGKGALAPKNENSVHANVRPGKIFLSTKHFRYYSVE